MLLPAILRLGKDTKVTTCFSDMSVAVNRTEGASLIWTGGLGPSLVGRTGTQPLFRPKSRGSGKLGSH